ncbi:MAG TPA: methylamine utilization protein [Plesiomonas shigelloides]|uniref:MauE/DoxX family redox-associated membrane protein n=1 Tax=Plesiomonas TaxID=702 RepID=UPI000EE0BA96|nr:MULTISPECIES: MauE/DoxX family redox-associated membrane protein [Plesiomonas]MCE5165497.1 DoxX family membrane protein [Plesiomonas sp. PI-19]QIY10249.1 DoxX family membrane protein [Plesiomonas shigelloides]HAD39966.1 methylamine utilization protein [Plesiomonas shigelloides]
MRLLILFCRILCGGFFIVSALTKLSHPSDFALTIAAFGLVLPALITPIAWLLILTELVVGLGVLCRRQVALVGMMALLVVFMAVLSYGMAIGLDINCGCLGQADLSGLPQALGRDAVLFGMCLLMWFKRASRLDAPKHSKRISKITWR